jgi:hypothetical protein
MHSITPLSLPSGERNFNASFSGTRTLFKLTLLVFFWGWVLPGAVAQSPTVSYSSPQVYLRNTAISNLSPTATNVPAQTFRNVSTYAGTGTGGNTNNTNPLLATFDDIVSMVMDARGNIYVAESSGGRSRIRRIAANGGAVVTLMDLNATNHRVWGLAINGSTGDLYFSVTQHAIYRIANTNSSNYPGQDPNYSSPSDATIEANNRMAGQRGTSGNNDNTTGTSARFNTPLGMDVDAANGFLYVADKDNSRIRRISLTSPYAVTSVSTSGVTITTPEDLVVAPDGVLFASSTTANVVYRIGIDGVVTNFAGSATAGYLDGQGTAARFNDPRGIDMDAAGNLYVADGSGTDAIRKITPGGYVSTLAGSGTGLSGTTEGVGTSARFNVPHDVIVDRTNSLLYVGDNVNDKVRKVEIGGYTVSPALPEGLSLNAATGVISGTPAVRSRQIYYSDDFDDAAGGTGTSTAGNAVYVGGWMRLTDALANGSAAQDGAFRVDASGVNTNGLQVDFKFINRKTSDGADGMSYSFAPDATITGGSDVSLGTGTGLSLSFSTWSGNTIKMNLYYGSGRTHSTSVSVTLLASNTSNNALWLGRTANISLTIDNDGKVTVKVDGTTVFNQVQLPASYASANKSTWYHVFRASTGFLSDVYAIDDLVIRQNQGAADHTVTAYNADGSATSTLNINVVDLPTVTTTAVSSITATTASSGGNVTSDGGSAVTARGVVYGTSPSPTIAGSKTTDGTGTGSFTSSLTGLNPNTTYYVRAYTTTAAGTAYGAEVSFITLTLPSLSTTTASSISSNAAISGGNITSDGGNAVTARGIVWSTSTNPTVALSTKTSDGTGTGSFTSSLTGLMPTTTYYVRAYATTVAGTAYGSEQTFTTLQTAPAISYTPSTILLNAGSAITPIILTNAGGTPDKVQMSTLAGSGSTGPFANGVGTMASLNNPSGLALDGSGNLYVAEYSNHRIRKITISSGEVTTLAGSGQTIPFSNGIGTLATFNTPSGIAFDGNNHLYVADMQNNRIRKISVSSGEVSTLAGNGSYALADGSGTSASFKFPSGVAVDGSGNVYVGDNYNNRIRMVTPAGVVSTLAGSFSGNADGSITVARFRRPTGITMDGSGNIYVADEDNHRIRKISSGSLVTTIAGSSSGFSDGTGTAAKFDAPTGVGVDVNGNIYVADFHNTRIRKITPANVVTTIAGSGSSTSANGVGTAASINKPYGVVVDASGNLFVSDFMGHRIRMISSYRIDPALPAGLFFDARTGTISGTPTSAQAERLYTIHAQNSAGSTTTTITLAIASSPTVTTTAANNVTAATATLNGTVNANGGATSSLTIKYSTSQATIDAGNGNIATVTPTSVSGNTVTAVSANITGLSSGTTYYCRVSATNATGTSNGTTLSFTTAAAAPSISYSGSPITLTVGTAMTSLAPVNVGGDPEPMQVSTLAGGSSTGAFADGTGTAARFNLPSGVATDVSGNVYVADQNNHRIRMITSAGVVTTLAGGGSVGSYADGTGTSARFLRPIGVTLDVSGNVYVADEGNHRIRKITSGGVVTTLAGGGSEGSYADGTGANARFLSPVGVALDVSGNVYVTDYYNHRIRKITSAGEVITLAGNSSPTYADGIGTAASFKYPFGVAVDGSGIIYVADINHRIRKITSGGVVTTLAGGGSAGSYADGTGSDARFWNPAGIALDVSGNVYVTDQINHRIRKVTSAGVVSTLAGGVSAGSRFADGTGTGARFSFPIGITVDGTGNLYVADQANHRIRKISNYSISPALPAGLSFNTATGQISGTPTALSPSTTYTVTASNGGGTSTATFTLEVTSNMLTSDASNIGETTATAGGTVGSLSGITERGVVYSTSAGPDITDVNDIKIPDGATSTGPFSLNLTGLAANQTYYIRSYVVHGGTTTYGSEKSFKTNRTMTMADVTKNFGDPAFFLTAPASNGSGAWTFTSGTTSVATTSGNTVTIVGAGASTITATQAAVAPYASATTTFQLTANGQAPSINLGIPTTTPLKDAIGLVITPTSNSGGTVTLSLGAGSTTANLSGSPGNYTLSSVNNTGDLIFQASVPATGNYAAGTLTRTMSVTKNNPTITFTLPASTVTYSNGLTQSLTATGGGSTEPVIFSVVSGPGTTTGTNGSTLNISGPGDIVIKASQDGDVNHNPAPDVVRTLTVNQAAPVITGFTPTSATEGDVVTITGSNFQNVSAVKFGGTAAASFAVSSATTITAVLGSGHTGAVSVTTTSGTAAESGFRYKALWTGATNAFNSTGNWSGGRVPQSDDDIIFSPTAASDLELDGDKTVGNVNFNGSGRSLKLGAHNLTVKGNLTMPGNISGSGRVIMGGTAAQTITGGGSLPELEITNTSTDGVVINASGDELTVSGTLRVGAGAKLNTNNRLRLTSNSSGTARVAALGTGASITGQVIAERYVKRNENSGGTGRAWRLVSVPVTGTGTLRDFFMNGRSGQDLTLSTSRDAETDNSGTPIVGHNYATATEANTAGFDWIGVANSVSSLRSYVGDAAGGSFASENVPDLDGTTFATAAQGYMVFTRGDRKLDFPSATSSGATTFRSTGTLKTGNINVSVAPASTSKFTLVGNPYMSVLDLSLLHGTNSAVINPSFWIWDANMAGTNNQGGYVNVYLSGSQWVTNTGSYIDPQLIESGMAFFVEPLSSLSTATDLTIMESHKSSASSAGLSPFATDQADDHGRMYVRLERADAKGQRQLIDGVMADFHSSFKTAFGDQSDREKLRNGISRGAMWLSTDKKILSSEGLPWPTETKRSIPLYMSGVGDQTLIVRVDPRGMRDRYVKAWLKDNVLKRQIEINMSTPTDYDFIGTGSAAWDSTRFEIVYVEASRPSTGVTLEPDDAAEQPSVKLYPNPSKSAEVKLSLRAMTPGTYTVHILDMTGRQVATSALDHRSVNGEYRILEGRLLSPGTYIIRLSDQNKQPKETVRLVVE